MCGWEGRGEGGQWEGKNKNRMGFNEGTWHSCKIKTTNKWNVNKQYTSNNENEKQVMGENEGNIHVKETDFCLPT